MFRITKCDKNLKMDYKAWRIRKWYSTLLRRLSQSQIKQTWKNNVLKKLNIVATGSLLQYFYVFPSKLSEINIEIKRNKTKTKHQKKKEERKTNDNVFIYFQKFYMLLYTCGFNQVKNVLVWRIVALGSIRFLGPSTYSWVGNRMGAVLISMSRGLKKN